MSIAAVRERVASLLDAPWTRHSRVALALIGASVGMTIVVAALGPSAVTLNVGPAPGPLPPWFVPADVGRAVRLPLSEWILVPALWVGIVLGAVGLWVGSRAIDVGWRPPIHKLFYVGVGLNLATALVPPLTSADVLMYAAYGRLQRQGVDPYSITPADVFRHAYDPVLVHTERPWQDTPSVYGPIASGSQWLANVLGGESMHDVVFWLQLFCVVPFIAICAVMVKLAHGDAERQTRAVLFTIGNPLLIWAVVAGAHNEPLSLVFAIAALFFLRRSAFVSGLLLGLAGLVKVSLVFYGLAMLWAYRRQPRRLLQLCLGAAVPLVVGYGILLPNALLAAGRNTGYISPGSWGVPIVAALEPLLGAEAARRPVTVLGWVLLVVIAWFLSRVVPWVPVPGARVPAREDPLTIATRTALVLTTAWVLTAPWSLPWYDLIAWAPLALLARNHLDRVLLVRGAALSVGYVTARGIEFSPALNAVSWVLRDLVCWVVGVWALWFVVRWWWVKGHEMPTRAFVTRGVRRILEPTRS